MAVVREIDHGLKAALARTSALAGSGVKVGYQAGAARAEGVDVLDIAIWNHYGTKGKNPIPSRPFMWDASVKYEHDIGLVMAHVAKKVQNGEADVATALATVGQKHQDQIAAQIRSGEFRANAASTIARKGSSKPLTDTGRVLIPALRYEVET